MRTSLPPCLVPSMLQACQPLHFRIPLAITVPSVCSALSLVLHTLSSTPRAQMALIGKSFLTSQPVRKPPLLSLTPCSSFTFITHQFTFFCGSLTPVCSTKLEAPRRCTYHVLSTHQLSSTYRTARHRDGVLKQLLMTNCTALWQELTAWKADQITISCNIKLESGVLQKNRIPLP